MSKAQSEKRLKVELRKILEEPTDLILAKPLESNILDWRFVIKGTPDGPYAGGVYMGRLLFPPEYPWKPPRVEMCTPNGRMAVDGTRICLSISDYHPESWCPSWTVGTILLGVISFFFTKEDTVGSVTTSDEKKRELARASIAYNAADKTFTSLFGATGDAAELFAEADAQIARRKAVAMGTAAGAGATVTATPMTVLTGSMAGAKIASAP